MHHDRTHSRPLRSLALTLLALAILAEGTSCVRRRLTIRSTPPGALVYVDDQEIGITPVSTPFTFYGTRTIKLVRDGYETLTVAENFSPPWYEYPVAEAVSENLWPGELRDERVLEFQLVPQRIVPVEELRARAEELRGRASTGAIQLPGSVPPPAPGSVMMPGGVGPGALNPPPLPPAAGPQPLPPPIAPPFAPQYELPPPSGGGALPRW